MKKLLLLMLSIFSLNHSFGQEATIDTSFDIELGINGEVYTSQIQSDGKIIVGGSFTTYAGTTRKGIIRLHPNGNLDTDFNPRLAQTADTHGVSISKIILLPDGKILINGRFTQVEGIERISIARLNQDGTLDASFRLDPQLSNHIYSIARQNDGKIVGINNISNNFTSKAVRINEDGSIDPTFDTGTAEFSNYHSVKETVIESDGRIICIGNFYEYNGVSKRGITRLNADGSYASIATVYGTKPYVSITGIALQPDGKLIVSGSYDSYPSYFIERRNIDGTRDLSFEGIVDQGVANCIIVQPNGKLLIAGEFIGYNSVRVSSITRLLSDGSLDQNFIPNNIFGSIGWSIKTLSVQPDGKIIAGGYFYDINNSRRLNILRLNADRALNVNNVNPIEFSIHPNPASSIITITNAPEGANLVIQDLTGKTVYQSNISGMEQIDVSHFPKGMYLAKINESVNKFIIQ